MRKGGGSTGIGVVGIGVVGLAAVQPAHATTQITFGGFSQNNVSISSIVDYGSKVSANSADYIVSPGVSGLTGTPDLVLTWGAGYQTYTAWDGRGNVAQLDFNTGPEISLTLAPVAVDQVAWVQSFDLDVWAGAPQSDFSVTWSISDSVGTLKSDTWTQNSGGRATINTGLNISDLRLGETVTLRYTLNSGSPSYLALANLTFDQVPEPTAVALCTLGLGLGAMAMRRRRS